MKSVQKGFTLIELMIVVAIIEEMLKKTTKNDGEIIKSTYYFL